AVQGGELPRDAASGAVRGAGAAVAPGGQGAGGPGDGLSEVPAQGAGPPLCQCRGAGRRPGTVSAWRAGAGAAGGATGTRLALGEAQPAGGLPYGRGGRTPAVGRRGQRGWIRADVGGAGPGPKGPGGGDHAAARSRAPERRGAPPGSEGPPGERQN